MKREKARISVAKWLDEYAGRWLIRAGRRLGLLRRNSTPPDSVRKILFIKFWGLGSIVLSQPALRLLRAAWPDAQLHYLTLARNRDLFGLLPEVHRVHTVRFASPFAFLAGSLRLLAQLRREKYDLVFDAEFFAHFSALLGRLAGGKWLVGFARTAGQKKEILDRSVPFRGDRHTAEQFLHLVGRCTPAGIAAGRAPTLSVPAFPALLKRHRLQPRHYVVLNVNASPLATERRWPRDRFIALARFLLSHVDWDLVLIGSAREVAYVAAVEKALDPRRVRNLAGKLTIAELAWVLQDAKLCISNDSGPLHLAAALGVPVVGFYGPETPVRYGPLAEKKLVFYQNLWCSPCMSVDNAKTIHCINDLACMRELGVEQVAAEVWQFIRKELLSAEPTALKLVGTSA